MCPDPGMAQVNSWLKRGGVGVGGPQSARQREQLVKGPQVGRGVAYLTNRKVTNVARAQWAMGRDRR